MNPQKWIGQLLLTLMSTSMIWAPLAGLIIYARNLIFYRGYDPHNSNEAVYIEDMFLRSILLILSIPALGFAYYYGHHWITLKWMAGTIVGSYLLYIAINSILWYREGKRREKEDQIWDQGNEIIDELHIAIEAKDEGQINDCFLDLISLNEVAFMQDALKITKDFEQMPGRQAFEQHTKQLQEKEYQELQAEFFKQNPGLKHNEEHCPR